MLNGCRALMRETNRDIVRDGLVSIGDAFTAGGELGNVPALTHGVHAGRVIRQAAARGDFSRQALQAVADFITPDLVKATEMNGSMKTMPLRVGEEEIGELFEIMKDVNYPTLMLGTPRQMSWMFTKVMLKNLGSLLRKPRLMKLMTGKA